MSAKSLKSQQGALTLELAISLPVLLVVIFTCFDLARLVQKYGELNRLAYSLATIVAQRDDFYRDKITTSILPLSQKQVDQLQKIAQDYLENDVAINVTEYASLSKVTRFSRGDCQGGSAISLPHQVNDNEPTVYVVELCQAISDFSLGAKFLSRNANENFYVRALMVGR